MNESTFKKLLANFNETIQRTLNNNLNELEESLGQRLSSIEERIEKLENSNAAAESFNRPENLGEERIVNLSGEEIDKVIPVDSEVIQRAAQYSYPHFSKRQNVYENVVHHIESRYKWFPNYVLKEVKKKVSAKKWQ